METQNTNPFDAMAERFNLERGYAVRTEQDCVAIRYLDEDGDTRSIFFSPGPNSVEIEFAKGRGGCTLNESTYRSLPTESFEQAKAILELNATCLMSSLLLESPQCHH